jgi:hypothetical protein
MAYLENTPNYKGFFKVFELLSFKLENFRDLTEIFMNFRFLKYFFLSGTFFLFTHMRYRSKG